MRWAVALRADVRSVPAPPGAGSVAESCPPSPGVTMFCPPFLCQAGYLSLGEQQLWVANLWSPYRGNEGR